MAQGDGGEAFVYTFNATGHVTVKLWAVDDATGEETQSVEDKVWVKYVRRELRALDDADRDAYFSALEAVFKTPCDDGKKMYGDRFECIDTFTAVHQGLAGDPYCDHAHDGYGFLTTHMALSMWFERALQSVQPRVTLPYWDYTIEMHSVVMAGGDISVWRQSEVWSADWFGTAQPSGHVVDSGRFAYQPVITHGNGAKNLTFTNSYGMMRAPWNNNR